MAKAAAAKSHPAPEPQPSDEATLWAARIHGVTPTQQRILLTLANDRTLKRTPEGNWIAYPSLSQLVKQAGVSKGSIVTAIAELIKRGILTRIGGNIKGDTTVYTLVRHRQTAPRSNIDLGQELTMVKARPRSARDHKSKEDSLSHTGSLDLKITSSPTSKPDDDVIVSEKREKSEKTGETRLHADVISRYVKSVSELYLENPGTPARFTLHDEHTALTWCGRGVPLERIAAALWLGVGRRGKPKPGQAPIGSLAYFSDVVAELERDPQPPGYVAYMRSRVLAMYPGRKLWPAAQPRASPD